MARLVSKFERGYGRYTCRRCGKQTRETGDGESQHSLCLDCFDCESQENTRNDDGHEQGHPDPDCRVCQNKGLVPLPD